MLDYNQQIESLQAQKQKLKDQYEEAKRKLQIKIESLKIQKSNQEIQNIKKGK